jgi:hypothetical protein
MSTPPNQQSDEYLQARIESCKLLGLNPDDLTAHEAIRADLATVLRLWLDGSQSTLLAGGSADPIKLLSVVEALTRLVPATEHKSRGEDPRDYMWKTYLEARRRGELAEKVQEPRLREQIAALQAEIATLRAGAPALGEPPGEVSGLSQRLPAAPAPGGNVVPLKPPPVAASAASEEEFETVVVQEAVLGEPEPWRNYISSDGSIMTPGKKDWGPVGR